ncbi:alpha-ketoglutarate-dependent dioxygenase AlkB family protein [Actinokineospora bangkokensis]|uniref:Alpha-ketoglutarate-dependent dioxygenase AlkB n=1 Tax=Actinokineospora bangkokensis TaxID=1193682 RepID=A0A1Q9LPS4_9PSEU|nr:alpha-ketoglutarate-dependent dioxygenase AlkB [Actinokineospora bangkokensis]OLR94047.1 alpha-ketoglutarate-dependent dioxygenase AlkB [Actinokineospora bangkokensis]
MPQALQASLWDGVDPPALGPLVPDRAHLDATAWVDVLPGWLTGADDLYQQLADEVPWRAERRQMYDSVVDVPRLLSFYRAGAALPHPVLAEAKQRLSAHYGEEFTTAGFCFYRDGGDSVAWHGDDKGRGSHTDTHVAILSLGSPRPLLLRPRGGGPTTRYPLGHGDLLVMGGACQRTWEHAIPKTARPVGGRISIQFRPHDVL